MEERVEVEVLNAPRFLRGAICGTPWARVSGWRRTSLQLLPWLSGRLPRSLDLR